MAPSDRSRASSIFVFHCNYGHILHRFEMSEIFVEKNRDFFHIYIKSPAEIGCNSHCFLLSMSQIPRLSAGVNTLCPQKQCQRLFSIFSLIFIKDLKFHIIWRTYSWVYTGHNYSCTTSEACAIPLPETFYVNDVLHKWNRLLVACINLDHSIVVAAISQWRRRLSACVRAHGGHFEHILWCFHGSVG